MIRKTKSPKYMLLPFFSEDQNDFVYSCITCYLLAKKNVPHVVDCKNNAIMVPKLSSNKALRFLFSLSDDVPPDIINGDGSVNQPAFKNMMNAYKQCLRMSGFYKSEFGDLSERTQRFVEDCQEYSEFDRKYPKINTFAESIG